MDKNENRIKYSLFNHLLLVCPNFGKLNLFKLITFSIGSLWEKKRKGVEDSGHGKCQEDGDAEEQDQCEGDQLELIW